MTESKTCKCYCVEAGKCESHPNTCEHCRPKPKTTSTWEERFDKEFYWLEKGDTETELIKDFIRQELATAHQSGIEEGRKQVIEEIEAELPQYEANVGWAHPEYDNEFVYAQKKNEAVQEILSILTNLKNK